MNKLFTITEQVELFEQGQQLFLDGYYTEAESILRLVMESALQHDNYKTVVSTTTLLNRIFVNTSQFDQLYTMIIMMKPYIDKYATDEECYFYRLHKSFFNNFHSIGDNLADFQQLFDELVETEYHTLTFITGSNLMFILLEHDFIEEGIVLLNRLEPLYQSFEFTNKMTPYMHLIYAFLLYYSNEDYEKADQIIQEIETSDKITIVESFAYIYQICKALNTAQTGDILYAKNLFHETLVSLPHLEQVRLELKLWVRTMQQFNLLDDVIFYQQMVIDLLESQYKSEVKQLRKESIEQLSLQFFEGQLYTDQLTKVNNRNFYENLLSKHQKVINYTIVVLDIDKFKLINDQYGHTTGDQAIKFIASQLNKWIPKHDISIVRYGGDEFIILIPYPLETMEPSIRSLHEKLVQTPLQVEKDNITIPLSVSIGISHTKDDYYTINELFERADKALYEAKKDRGTLYISGE